MIHGLFPLQMRRLQADIRRTAQGYTHTAWKAKPRLELGCRPSPRAVTTAWSCPPHSSEPGSLSTSGRQRCWRTLLSPIPAHLRSWLPWGPRVWSWRGYKGIRAAAMRYPQALQGALRVRLLPRCGVSRCLRGVGGWDHRRKAGGHVSLLSLLSV